MLQVLRIRELALIDELTWELHAGLNILSGETGAGKSILIDALQLLLGERADRSLIRDGAEECVVEAMFDDGERLAELLREHGMEAEGGELVLKRIITAKGANRQFINGSPAPLQVLKKIGDVLVDFHGPYDHQSLLQASQQLAALDAYGKVRAELGAYTAAHSALTALEQEREELQRSAEGDVGTRLELLDHQIGEIEAAQVRPGEEERLEADYHAGTHAKRIVEIAGQIDGLIGGEEASVLDVLARCQKLLQEWRQLDPGAEVLAEQNASVVGQLQDLRGEVENRASSTEIDPARLAEMEERLNLLQSLKRKHGPTLENVLEKLERLRGERESLGGRGERLAALGVEIRAAEARRKKCGQELSSARAAAAPKLAKAITAQLRELGFKQANFEVALTAASAPRADGMDAIEFVFAPNPGEPPRPLKAIASSGEMARVMLAVKSVLAGQDQVPVLIFDEVDANVGGETAVAVGKKLRAIAAAHQVLCITHLPQVAAAGHAHHMVEKDVKAKRTMTRLRAVEGEDRVDELARMLGGKSDSARKLARSLLTE